jgi:hypothetical protein
MTAELLKQRTTRTNAVLLGWLVLLSVACTSPASPPPIPRSPTIRC